MVGKVDRRTLFSKAAAKLGGVIEIAPIKPYEIPKFASGYCRQEYGKTLNSAAAQMLVQLVGDEVGRICSEIEKLSLFTGSRKTITEADVQHVVGANRIYGAFEVIDAIMERKIDEGLCRLRNMFQSDKSTEYTVIGAFGYHFRRLFAARAMLDKGHSQQAVARKIGNLWGARQDRFFAQVRPLSLEQLARFLATLGQIDFGIKRGKTTAPSAMERFVLQISSFSAR